MESLEQLVRETDFPCFTTDAFVLSSARNNKRISIPIEEPEAYMDFYIAYRQKNKRNYAALFNAIRSHAIQSIH